jgi:hypothetical protein
VPEDRWHSEFFEARYRRRSVLKGGAVAAIGLSLSGLELLRWAGPAAAVTYYDIDGVCYINDEDTTNDLNASETDTNWTCNVGCGPSLASSSFCHDYAPAGSGQWHKNDGVNYRLRPNQCEGARSSAHPAGVDGWDGWKWSKAGCSDCPSNQKKWFRCHDGQYKSSGVWKNSICQYTFCA